MALCAATVMAFIVLIVSPSLYEAPSYLSRGLASYNTSATSIKHNSQLFILKGIISVTSHFMEMRSFTLKPLALIAMTALKLKHTGRFREQMEKQRCTLW